MNYNSLFICSNASLPCLLFAVQCCAQVETIGKTLGPYRPLQERVHTVGGAMLISVIVTTYNREDALDAALRALSRQSDGDFEIVIADDGSRDETRALIENWRPRLKVPLKHVRHEHRGFRGGEIRNRGIAASAGDVCIFLDGDCLAGADFVAAHRRLFEPGWFVTGNRVLLSRELTDAVLTRNWAVESWSFAALLRQR